MPLGLSLVIGGIDVYISKTKISTLVIGLLLIGVFIAFPIFHASGQAKADTYKYKLKTTENLNVRNKAGMDSKVFSVLKKGSVVYASKFVNGFWYRIKYNGKTGYISSAYVKKQYTLVTYTKTKDAKMKVKGQVRASASTKSKKLATYKKGKKIKLTGHYITSKNVKWYTIKYKKKKRYILGKQVELIKAKVVEEKGTVTQAADTQAADTQAAEPEVSVTGSFEIYMKEQGFPDSYKPYLRKLHKAHPKWVFVAKNTGYTWKNLMKKATATGVNLIDSSVSKKWRSKKSNVYNSKTGKWIKKFDGGRWYQATDAVIAYYLDPRNFLNKDSIFQFMSHNYNSKYQNGTTIKSIVSRNPACFMNNNTYIGYLKKAGAASKVNPNVLAAMIIEEQGWYGKSGLISGKTAGYRGYYNFFNIGAYSANGMTAVQRGLWYAKGAGTGATTFGRPWDTKYKAIKGGAEFYHMYYVGKNQYNYYSKKFNVFNGAAAVGTHEYMTNVMGAEEEGRIVKYAYEKSTDYAIKFYIPVYKEMPAKACPRPAS